MKPIALLFTLTCVFLLNASVQSAQAEEEVNLYSARKEALIRPLLDSFTESTGIKVNLITSKADALLKRIETEGKNSPADVLLTTDAGRLYRAKQANIFRVIDSEVLESSIPAQYQDADNQWFGLSLRARPIMVTNTENAPKSYQDLTNKEYKKQICIRSSSNVYNQSLVASLIADIGADATEQWAKGVVANMARPPQGGDRDQIRGAAAGQCSIVVANTYYLGKMLNGDTESDDYKAASKLSIVWPNQDSFGVHVNVSGAGVLKTAPNADNAVKLIEFLASDTAQEIYANVNFEYPVKEGVKANETLTSWGEFKANPINLTVLGNNNSEAVKLMDRAGWK